MFARIKDDIQGSSEGLIIVAEDDTVYSSNKGTITTFLPYRNSSKDKLIDYEYC